jgi:tyrosyl-tRNA synthetase
VVFIIGDFTARIGDPSERTETRKMLTPAEVKKNAETYQKQVFQILDPGKTEVRYNSEWLENMEAPHFLDLTSKYTVARLLERDDFQKRYRAGEPIALVEFLYPLFQGYDSVIVRADVEIGGTDQKFNLLVGRELQREWKCEPQVVLTLPLIEGTDGSQKMSKSLANHIALKDTPRQMYGKIMSLPDTLMERYYRYVAPISTEEVETLLGKLGRGEFHPRDAKARLAFEIVKAYHSEKEAGDAAREFDHLFKEKGLPEEIETVRLKEKEMNIVSLLKETGLVPSKMEARRLISQGGVKIDSRKVSDEHLAVSLEKPVLVQCGKRRFLRVQRG